MINHTLKVLIVEDDIEYSALVQHWLSSPCDGPSFELAWADSLESAKERLANGGIDVVVLDLGLPDSDGLRTFIEVRDAQPELPVILLSAGNSETTALQAVQHGAQDYLVKGTCTCELLLRAVRYAHLRHLSQARGISRGRPVSGPRIVGLLGAKGGVGVTTIACILAEELRVQTEQRVLLADLDAEAGSVAFFLGAEPRYSLADAAGSGARLDLGLWQSVVTDTGNGLDVLSSPSCFGRNSPPADAVSRVLTFAQQHYDWMVLDLARLAPLSVAILPLVTDLLLVTTASLPSLFEAKRVIGNLTAQNADHERLRVIVNDTNRTDALQSSDLTKLFGAQVFAQIPNDDASMQSALMRKTLPGEGSSVRSHIRQAARNLAGVKEPKPKSRRGIPQMLSFLTKSTSVAATAGQPRD